MKVLITGGLGFIGTQLTTRFLARGDTVTVVNPPQKSKPHCPSGMRYVPADTTIPGTWQEEVSLHDLIINLAGAPIFRRWNKESKQLIHNSRVLTTQNVVQAMKSGAGATLLSTSAVGYYGFRGDEELIESSPPGDDFLARLCVEWESKARSAERKGARVVITRFGIVLGRNGGALQQMLSAFEKFVGGPLGSGKQWFSWIHMEDLLNSIMFLVDTPRITGPVNCCSPRPVRNKDLAKALGRILHRPSLMSTPRFALKVALGEFATVLLEGQRVVPAVLLQNGFHFMHTDVEEALIDILTPH